MRQQQTFALGVIALVMFQMVLPAVALPNLLSRVAEQGRKFAVKPNNQKKVITESNEILAPQEKDQVATSGGGFQWMSVFNMLLQLFITATSPSSGNEKIDTGASGAQGFNWINLVNLGLRLIYSAVNNGVAGAGGLEKNDPQSANPSSMQALLMPLMAGLLGGQEGKLDISTLAKQAGNIVQLLSSLMDALKVSFSQRSSHARSLGSKDPFSDAAVAAVTIMKGYVNTHKTSDEVCMQRIMCEANNECSRDAPDSGYLFCQLGTYAAGYLLERSTYTPLDAFTTAGRQGRTGESCVQIYSQCNEL